MRWLNKKEAYLYGQLDSLMRDQVDALTKYQNGTLGVFGRNRLRSRDDRMAKVVSDIIRLHYHRYELEQDVVIKRALTEVSAGAQGVFFTWGMPWPTLEFVRLWFNEKGAQNVKISPNE